MRARQQVMSRYIALSDRSTGPGSTGVRDVTHLIWPESAFPFFLQREADAMAQIADLLPPGTVLIVGAARPATAAPTPGRAARLQFDLRDRSRRLDPVGLRQDASGAVRRVSAVPGFPRKPRPDAAHQGARRLHSGREPQADHRAARAARSCRSSATRSCFPGEAVPRGERPGWLVNLTNDGWFGRSSGPYQHLQQARVRAIEEGLPLVRAANTGVSAVIDPVGRIVRSLPLGTEGVLDASLPRALEPTFYARFGDGPIGLLVLAALALVLWRRLRAP